MDKKDKIILQQLDVIRSMTENKHEAHEQRLLGHAL